MSSPAQDSGDHPDASTALKEAFTNAALDQDAMDIKSCPTKGSKLDLQLIHAVGDAMKRRDISRGTVLWNSGDESDRIYLISTGELAVQYFENKRYRIVEILLRGSMVGALEMLSQQPRYEVVGLIFVGLAGLLRVMILRFGI
jgi:CRP-like cAMP-binding protein